MSALQELFDASPLARLDDGQPEAAVDALTLRARAGELGGLQRVALGCVLLRHGHLEPAHVEAQAVSGPYGDWLHAIMHRMEGDYGNARYWCHQAGGEELYAQVAEGFSPTALTDQVADLGRDFDSAAAQAARELQARELTVLFTHCLG